VRGRREIQDGKKNRGEQKHAEGMIALTAEVVPTATHTLLPCERVCSCVCVHASLQV